MQNKRESRISVGDYIRLLQMKREIDQKKPKSVEVKWVDNQERKMLPTNNIQPAPVTGPVPQVEGAIQGLLGFDRLRKEPGSLPGSYPA